MRILEHYQPVLGLPDTLKAKAGPVRETGFAGRRPGHNQGLRLQAPLDQLQEEPSNRWKHLREVNASDRTYPLLNADAVEGFRQEAHGAIHELIRSNFLPGRDRQTRALPRLEQEHRRSFSAQCPTFRDPNCTPVSPLTRPQMHERFRFIRPVRTCSTTQNTRQSVRAEGIRKYLHPSDESDDGCLRETGCGAGGRCCC